MFVVVVVNVVSVDPVVKRRTSSRGLKLCCAKDQMHAGISVNGAAHLPDLKSERGIFERFLHLAASKRTQIAPTFGRAAVGKLGSQLFERLLTGLDLFFIALEYFESLFLRPGDVVRSPAGGSSRVTMLDKQMGRLNLTIGKPDGRLSGHLPLRLLGE